MTSNVHPPIPAASDSSPAYAASAQMTGSRGNQPSICRNNTRAPLRSVTLAAVTATASTRPSVSTATWRLRPTTPLAPSYPRAPFFDRLDGLAVDDRRRGRRPLAGRLAHPLAQRVV